MKKLSTRQAQAIESLTYQKNYLNITFKTEWYQEDITALVNLLLSPIKSLVIKEKNIGADREDVRFSWHACYFVLSFDYYSQSCWIEGQDSAAIEFLKALQLVIEQG
ncbi:MAG: DUF3630 family protein [Colwellia sp.]